MGLLYVRTGNAGSDPAFLVDDLGYVVPTGASWTLLASSSPADADGSSGLFSARELRDSADLFDNIRNGNLEWSQDGSAVETASDYVADFMIAQDFTDDFLNMTEGRIALPNGTSTPASGVEGEIFWDSDDDMVHLWDGDKWVDIPTTLSGNLEHGNLSGLGDDDHTQYHNDARGDARYYQQSEHLNVSAGAGDAGKPVVLNVSGFIDETMLDIDAWEVNFDPTDVDQTDVTNVQDAIEELYNVADATSEPTGFVNQTDSEYSFVAGTRTFTIQPTGSSYDYYLQGDKTTVSSAKSIVIPDTEGVHFIYFDDDTATLKSTTTWTNDLLTTYAYVANIYWDATNNVAVMIGDERHGIVMDADTHAYLHTTRGTAWESGLALANLNVDGDGSSNADAQFMITNGVIRDEDIRLAVTDGDPQELDPLANLPVLYREGASGDWRRVEATAYPLIYNGNPAGYTDDLVAYNEYTGSTWALTEVAASGIMLMHVFATNDLDTPMFAVVGQEEYSDLQSARLGATTEINSLAIGNLPFNEFFAVATVLYQTSADYSNTPAARIVSTDEGDDYIDWRFAKVNPTGGLTSADHGNLSGLGDDDHLQYLNETRHDALPADNPHSVTFTQAVTADGSTDISAAEAETLTDGSNADSLHTHDFASTGHTHAHSEITGVGANDHHNELHTVASHSDTDATGAELNTLTDGSNADSLHEHDHGSLTGNEDDDHTRYLDLGGDENRNVVSGAIDITGGDLLLPTTTDVSGETIIGEGQVYWDSDDDSLFVYDGTQWVDISSTLSGVLDHGTLVGLGDDDHTQYLTETRHDSLPADNPHSVTFTQAVTADGGTDITAAEAETLTDGSNADALHVHDHGNLEGNEDDDHSQYLLLDGDGTRNTVSGTINIDNGRLVLPHDPDVEGTFTSPAPVEGEIAWDDDDDMLKIYDGSVWVDIPTMISGIADHHSLNGLEDDDHPLYPNITDNETISGLWTFDPPDTEPNIVLDPRPSAPTVNNVDGAISVIDDALYTYDATRGKWLSVDRIHLHATKNGNAKNVYLRIPDSIATSQTGYRAMRDCTITAISAQTDDAETWTLEIRKNGVATPIASLAMSAVKGNQDTTINVNLDQGDEIQFFANVAGSAIKAPVTAIELAWRQ